MLIVFTSSAVDHGFDPWLVHTKDYEIGIYCFSGKHTSLWNKSKHWLARNQNNMSELHVYPRTALALPKSNLACSSSPEN